MKKTLLLGGSMLLAATAYQANAQLAMENFNSGLPATWSMVNADNHTISTSLVAKIISGLSSNAWMVWTRGTNDSAMLTTSWFSPAAKADRWLISPAFTVTDPKMILSWLDAEGISSANDSLQIWVSPTAGTTTASFTTKVADGPVSAYETNASTGAYVYHQHGASLGAYMGQSIRIAFRNNSTDQGVSLVDDVRTLVMPNALDGSVDGVTFTKIVGATSSTPVKVVVSNQGAATLSSVQLTYKIDAGAAVSQTFSGLSIAPFGAATLTFTAPVANPAAGQHTILVTLMQVNGAADPIATNNTKSTIFAAATQSTGRNGLMEEFSSSTCAPCKTFNATFDPLVVSNNANSVPSKFNIVKYQMNWPSPGNDVSYNNQGNTRRGYYGVTGIPDHFTNGAQGGNGDQAEITASKTAAAYMDISNLTYVVKKDSLIATATITPYFTLSGAGNYRIHMVAAEDHYINPGNTTGQTDYYHVMRNMLGNGSGTVVTSWTAGTPQTIRWAHQWVKGTVAQMSNTYWNHPIGDGELVVFVQDETAGTILQSAVTKASWPLGVESLNNVISQAAVYPNPASDHTSVAFKLETAKTVGVQVLDATGRVVYSVADQKMGAGTQMIQIPTTSFASGMYTIKVQAEEAAITQRLSVVK